jgi:hypothetical protein
MQGKNGRRTGQGRMASSLARQRAAFRGWVPATEIEQGATSALGWSSPAANGASMVTLGRQQAGARGERRGSWESSPQGEGERFIERRHRWRSSGTSHQWRRSNGRTTRVEDERKWCRRLELHDGEVSRQGVEGPQG